MGEKLCYTGAPDISCRPFLVLKLKYLCFFCAVYSSDEQSKAFEK